MSKVRIVTDSNAYLPQDMLEEYEIEVIPHRIKVGSAFLEETAEFDAESLFGRVVESQSDHLLQLPDVHAADINTILDMYRNVGQGAEEIVSIHMSSELSPMWKQARRAAEMLKGRYTIRVIDSLSTSYGLGILVEQAAIAAENGADVHEIARIINGSIPHMYMAVFAESLPYLERSAGLGSSQSVLGTMLGIKALLMMEDGRLMPLEKVQTREDVVEKLYEFVVEFASVEKVGIMQHGYQECQENLCEQFLESIPHVQVESLTFPPSLAAYLGPNMVGVVVYEGTL